MAVATNIAHVSRAIEFYNKGGMYFCIGGTSPWEDETSPPDPKASDYKLNGIIAFKRIDDNQESKSLVIEDKVNGTIEYNGTKWRRVVPRDVRTNTTSDIRTSEAGDYTTVTLNSLTDISEGCKVRINNSYEAVVRSISGTTLSLSPKANVNIPTGASVVAGAYVEGARNVYIKSTLSYDNFPTEYPFRQIGVCTDVQPNKTGSVDILKSALITGTTDEYSFEGYLQILDNRAPIERYSDQQEVLSMVIEF